MLTKFTLVLVAAVALLGCDSDNRPPSDVPSPADGSVPPTGGTGGAGTGGAPAGGTGGGADDDAGGLGADAAAGKDAAATDAGPVLPDAGMIDAFDGMCAASNWSTFSDACWSCWCTQCAATLNVATRRSMEIWECMFEKELLVVNDLTLQLPCEVRAAQQECVDGSTADWDKLVSFDQCLMAFPPLGASRHCETECGVTYTGTVCARYP